MAESTPPTAEDTSAAGPEGTEPTARTEGEGPALAVEELELIWVESALETDQVALYEKNPAHPEGEAFVGPGPAVQVAKTPAVVGKLNSGEIKESSEPAPEEDSEPATAPASRAGTPASKASTATPKESTSASA